MTSEPPYPGAEPASDQPYRGYQPQPYLPAPSWSQDDGARFGPTVPPAEVAPTAAPPTVPPPTAPPSPTAPRQGASKRMLAAAALVAAVVGGGVGAGTATLVSNGDSGTVSAGLNFSTQAAPAAKVDGTVSAAAAKIGPSVVTIHVSATGMKDTGSGVIIRKDGYILTNNHVVSAAATGGGSISVVLSDGRTARATVVGTDPSDDLAVIKIGLKGLTAATFASSSKLEVGQTVVAVGAPLGLSDTVTAGIVSSTARPVTTSDQNDQAVFNAVQTDAAINPGNSGGPLVNLNGDVVGINAAIATDQSQGGLLVPGQPRQAGNIGIGFAIPSDEAGRIAGELIRTGNATHAVMGVTVSDAAAGGSAAATGAKVRSVTAAGPAAKAGMKAGDVVTRADDQVIDDATALVAAIRSHAPGQQVDITYVRDGASHTVTITLGTANN